MKTRPESAKGQSSIIPGAHPSGALGKSIQVRRAATTAALVSVGRWVSSWSNVRRIFSTIPFVNSPISSRVSKPCPPHSGNPGTSPNGRGASAGLQNCERPSGFGVRAPSRAVSQKGIIKQVKSVSAISSVSLRRNKHSDKRMHRNGKARQEYVNV